MAGRIQYKPLDPDVLQELGARVWTVADLFDTDTTNPTVVYRHSLAIELHDIGPDGVTVLASIPGEQLGIVCELTLDPGWLPPP